MGKLPAVVIIARYASIFKEARSDFELTGHATDTALGSTLSTKNGTSRLLPPMIPR